MNIALPALIIVLGILPGIACFYGYFARGFDKRSVGVNGVEELAFYVGLAIPMDVIALLISRHWGHSDLDFPLVLRLLAGSGTEASLAHAEQTLSANVARTALTYFLVLAFSFIAGIMARRAVWASRLDCRMKLLRIRHDLFYLLQGRSARLPRHTVTVVDVLCRHPHEQSRLYRGYVFDFELAPGGGLQWVQIINAQRGKGRDKEFHWQRIAGDNLIIFGSDVHSMNVSYIVVDERRGSRFTPEGFRDWWTSFTTHRP